VRALRDILLIVLALFYAAHLFQRVVDWLNAAARLR